MRRPARDSRRPSCPGQVRHDSGQPEVPLLGGIANRGLVFRVGETVRRPLRPTSPATHALLRHLAEVGFDGAPRSLGVDRQGREVLSYIPGDAIVPPYPAWALTDAAIGSVARLLRRYHEAVSTFDPRPHTWPESPPPPPFGTGLVCHNDPNLDNVVFRDGEAVALIDFDLARPGSRLWDVAAAARLWAPLRRDVDIEDARRGHALGRFRLFVDAYGLVGADRDRLVDAVISNHDWLYGIVSRGAENGNPGFVEYWRTGAADRAGRTRRWYVLNAHLLREALR
jgi:hypothetical protein